MGGVLRRGGEGGRERKVEVR